MSASPDQWTFVCGYLRLGTHLRSNYKSTGQIWIVTLSVSLCCFKVKEKKTLYYVLVAESLKKV